MVSSTTSLQNPYKTVQYEKQRNEFSRICMHLPPLHLPWYIVRKLNTFEALEYLILTYGTFVYILAMYSRNPTMVPATMRLSPPKVVS